MAAQRVGAAPELSPRRRGAWARASTFAKAVIISWVLVAIAVAFALTNAVWAYIPLYQDAVWIPLQVAFWLFCVSVVASVAWFGWFLRRRGHG